MWTWCQDNGALKDADGHVVTLGWAGNHAGKNNPDMQSIHGVGPIPCGLWGIGAPQDKPNTGPYSLPLTPELGTDALGRSGFFMHGAALDPELHGQESEGCPVVDRIFRERVWQSGDHLLNVVPHDDDATAVA